MSTPAAVNSKRRQCPVCWKKPGYRHSCKGCQKWFCPQCVKPSAHHCTSISAESMGPATGCAHDSEPETETPKASTKHRAQHGARSKRAGRKRQASAHREDGSARSHHSDAPKQWTTAHTQPRATDRGDDDTWGTWGPSATRDKARPEHKHYKAIELPRDKTQQ